MNPNGLVARVLAPILRAAEGAFRPGPYYLPISGGWLGAEAGSYANWWQLGYNLCGGERSAVVEACISAYAQTIAICPGDHWRSNTKGGKTRVTNSAVSRILRKPNAYQTISDFLLNLVDSLYREGNAYALALRNDRFEISELHLMNARYSRPQLAVTGDIFYRLGGNDVIAQQLGNQQIIVPQRDVLHVRLRTDYQVPRPLIGESPLMAAMADIIATSSILQQQISFYQNEARPSAVLLTEKQLDKDQIQFLRDRWDEQTRGINQGKTPIITDGLKLQPWATSGGKDSQIAEIAKISDQRIALAFRIPLQILGIGGTPYSSAELLMASWIALGLGFALNHVEEAFGLLFGLNGQPEDYIEFDTDALLRSALKDRIDALVKGVQGGIYAPNEARAIEGYDAVPFGDSPRVQAQVVPLEFAGKVPPAPTPQASPSAPATPQPAKEQPQPVKEQPAKDYHATAKRESTRLIESAARARRRFVA
jgi:HK97 family phage portal protein